MKTVKNYSPKTKILSLILSFLIVFYLVPTSVFAEKLDNDTTVSDGSVSKNEENSTYTPEIYEVTELREDNVKHFRLEDGSYVAAQYNYPVHYADENGQFVDIDNRLIGSGSEFSTNNSRVKFIKKITGNGNIFTLHENNTKITMGLVGAEKKTEGIVISSNNSDDATESKLGKMTNLENLSSTIVYEDILEGVDIEYIVHSLNIKENIIVKEKKENYSYTFTLELNNLTATLADDGNVYINSLDGETQYVIPAPVVYDANGVYAPEDASAYALSTTGNGKYELTVTVESDWMNEDDRAFPVTIDPTIGVPHSFTVDLDVSSNNPNINFEGEYFLSVSSARRTYWKIPTACLPTLPSTAHLWKAELNLFGSGLDSYVGAYEITSDWDETLTWSKTVLSPQQGTFGSDLLDYQKLGDSDQWYAFDITEAAKKWYDGENNYGVGFKLVDGTDTTKSALFYSYEYYDSDGVFTEPCFYVYYSDISGLEDYYSLSSHSVAGIGSGSVNLATGNLTFISDLVSTTDYLMPMTVSAVYNSDMSGKDYTISNSYSAYATSYMPYGFKLNIMETIIEKTMWNESGVITEYCILLDSDGTNHYFYSSDEEYIDDSAQGRTLTKLANGNIEITYRDQSKKTFIKMSSNPSGTSGGWVLSKITDSSGNSIIITFDSSYRPSRLRLLPNGKTTTIDMISFGYSGDKLYQIMSLSSHDYVTFNYSSTYNGTSLASSGKYLRKITYGNNNSTAPYTIAQIYYNSNGKIINAQNDSLSSKFVYNWIGNKASRISEYGNGVLGQQVAYIYGNGYTDIRSTGNDEQLGTADDIMTRHVYDIYGRTVSAYSGSVGFNEIYGATMGEYETAPAAKNSIKESTIVYDGKVDYISDGNSYDATLQGGITKTEETGSYKQTVFELSNPESVTYNANMQYIISGFGYSNSITQNNNAKFSLSARVYYYQGEGEDDIVATHHFDFVDVENAWQFVSGKLDCKIDSPSARYNVVRKIELICNYYGQIDINGTASYANFKDVAFTNCSDYKSYRYTYDVDTGNLITKSNYSYREYYEYNDKNSITRIANNRGEIYDYVYQSNGITLSQEIYYTFNRTESFQGQLIYDYPFGEINIESKIVKTLVNQTSYSYDSQGLLTSTTSMGSNPSVAGIVNNSYTYETASDSKIYGALLTETDSLGHTIKYFYDSSNGNLLAQIDVESGSGYVYDYDEFGTLISVIPATGTATSYTGVTNAENVSYEYDPNTHRLTQITTASTEYSFSYDAFGNSTGVTAGNNTLATYEYGENNGKIETINYGNGFSEDYVYNSLEMLSEIWYTVGETRTKAYSYTYNKDGTLAKFENYLDGIIIEYEYDYQGRFVSSCETSSSNANYKNDYVVDYYNEDGQISEASSYINYSSPTGVVTADIGEMYLYNKNGTLNEERIFYLPGNGIITIYSYDNFNRVTNAYRYTDDFVYEIDCEYLSDGNSTSYLIGSYTSTVGSFSTTYNYTYDSKGNITVIDRNGTETTYTYDDLGQLTREIQGRVTKNYTYDDAGNITSIQTITISNGGSGVYALQPLPGVTTTTIPLTYANSEWGDLLTSYNGTTITYDTIGNPLTYYNGTAYTFEWEGRRLVGAETATKEMYFTYDDNGIRTSKTVDEVTHTYYLNGSQIIAEQWADKLLVYLYDAIGSPIGMMFRKTSYAPDQWDVFWFEKNLQGDIISVYNDAGAQVAYYTYHDAWGNHTAYTTNVATEGAQYNPFRYRGYYYDTDLGMYYLQSRYYDAKICRFINEDSLIFSTILGANLFAYCDNNPVLREDPTGRGWFCADVDLDEDDMSERGGGSYGAYYGPGSAYHNFYVKTKVADYDGNRGGYYSNGLSSAMKTPNAYIVPGAVSVTDDMATSIKTNYTPPKGGGGVTSTINTKGVKVTFGHGGRHISSTKFSFSVVERAIANDVVFRPAVYTDIGKVIINIMGHDIEYHYRTLSDDLINVGTYFEPK